MAATNGPRPFQERSISPLAVAGCTSWLRWGRSRLMRMFLYPWTRIGLIHPKKARLMRSLFSSGDCLAETSAITEGVRGPRSSNASSSE